MRLLQRLESELAAMSLPKRLASYLLLLVLLILAVWGWWIDPMLQRTATLQTQNEKLEREILLRNPKKFLEIAQKTQLEKIALAKRLDQDRALLKELQAKARQYRFLWFDEGRFLAFLEAVLRRSLELGLTIDRIEKLAPQKKSKPTMVDQAKTAISNAMKKQASQAIHIPTVMPQRSVAIVGSGRYPDLVKLLYFIESFNLLLAVDRTEIRHEDNATEIHYRVLLKQYGMEMR